MSFSTLVVVGLLHFVGSAQGFSGVSGARFVSQRPRVLPALRAVNEFDAWQAVRGAQTTDAPGALPLSTDNVALVLGEFARSDFARRLCKPGSVSVVEQLHAMLTSRSRSRSCHVCTCVRMPFTTCAHHGLQKSSTDTSRVPACRYDLNDQPDEGQVSAVFESVPKLTRGLGVLYVRATRTGPPRAARTKGASHCTSYVAHVPASGVPHRPGTVVTTPGRSRQRSVVTTPPYRGYHPRSVRLADATLIVKLKRSYG